MLPVLWHLSRWLTRNKFAVPKMSFICPFKSLRDAVQAWTDCTISWKSAFTWDNIDQLGPDETTKDLKFCPNCVNDYKYLLRVKQYLDLVGIPASRGLGLLAKTFPFNLPHRYLHIPFNEEVCPNLWLVPWYAFSEEETLLETKPLTNLMF